MTYAVFSGSLKTISLWSRIHAHSAGYPPVSAVTLCVQLVHFDLVNAVVDCADIFVVRCRNDTADMRAEVTLCHTAKALVEHAVHQTSEAAVLMGMLQRLLSVM